ncbi:hypothetical protein D9980_17765 [Serratia sp. 3ACOL1]|jgi:hypothetical protein|nr:hypothetical protein D9980_17765 [Serratia sp. 3ACOL1]
MLKETAPQEYHFETIPSINWSPRTSRCVKLIPPLSAGLSLIQSVKGMVLLYYVYQWLKELMGGLESNRSAQGKPKTVWYKNIAIATFGC